MIVKSVLVLFIAFSFPIQTKEASSSENQNGKYDAVFQVNYNFGISRPNDIESTKQVPFTNPCSCDNFKCSCCAGVRIIGLGFDRLACAEMTYEPLASVVDLKILLNNASIYSNTLSTRNRQVCVPVLPITLVGPFDVCVRMYDMNVVEQRLHACLAMLARVSQYPVMVLQFNCMEMGPGGVGLTRPIGGNYNQSAVYPSESFNFTTSDAPQQDSEVFDPITETTDTNYTAKSQ